MVINDKFTIINILTIKIDKVLYFDILWWQSLFQRCISPYPGLWDYYPIRVLRSNICGWFLFLHPILSRVVNSISPRVCAWMEVELSWWTYYVGIPGYGGYCPQGSRVLCEPHRLIWVSSSTAVLTVVTSETKRLRLPSTSWRRHRWTFVVAKEIIWSKAWLRKNGLSASWTKYSRIRPFLSTIRSAPK